MTLDERIAKVKQRWAIGLTQKGMPGEWDENLMRDLIAERERLRGEMLHFARRVLESDPNREIQFLARGALRALAEKPKETT